MKRVLIAIAVVVVLVAGGVAFELHRRAQARESDIAALLESGRIELGRDEPDHDAMLATLRRLRTSPEDDPRLRRIQARLEMALGRYQDAWETLRPLALLPVPSSEDAGLAARIFERRFAERGDRRDADRAIGFAEQHYQGSDDVSSLFLAWELAARTGEDDRAGRFADLLGTEHPDSPFTKLLMALAAAPPDLETLHDLESDFETPPPELDLVLALGMLEKYHASRIDEVLERVERLLREEPSWVEARHAAALAYHVAGDRDRRDAHLHWLLENAPAEDRRRPAWEAMLEQPVQRR